MRIVNRETFLAMPAGTIFAKYTPHIFGELGIKEETIGQDFVVQDLSPWFGDSSEAHWDTLERVAKGEESPPLEFDFAGRDGLFDQEQLFAVLGREDVKALIARLQLALSAAEGQ